MEAAQYHEVDEVTQEPAARGRGSAETLPARSALQKLGILLLLLVLH